jgi:hypothetical protein
VIVMRNMRWPVVAVAGAAFAGIVRADTCSSVASSTSIEIKERFDLEYTSMLPIRFPLNSPCTALDQRHGVVNIKFSVKGRPDLSVPV